MNIIIERTIELNAPLLTEPLPGSLFTTEAKAHQFLIGCTQNGAPVTLSGTVSAKFIREANNTTILMSGSISGGKASLILPADCYNISGRFDLTIFVTASNVTTCIYSATGSVKAAQDGTLVDEGTVVPSIEQLQQDVTNLQNNKVNRSGDTMTGALNAAAPIASYHSTTPSFAYKTNASGNPIGESAVRNNTRQMFFREYASDTAYHEDYLLPAHDTGATGNATYNILTTKQTLIVPTPASGVTINAGGVIQLGRVAIVSMQITTTATIGRDTALMTGMPVSAFVNAAINGLNSSFAVTPFRAGYNALYPSASLAAGTYYISGAYITT